MKTTLTATILKLRLLLLLVGLLSIKRHCQAQSPPGASQQPVEDYAVVQVGPHSRIWKNSSGQSVTEIATGINYWDGQQWVRSNPQFVISPDGTAFVASEIQDPTRLAANLNCVGAVKVTTPDGVMLRSTPIAIGLYDAASGLSAIVATLTNSIGIQVDAQDVVYNNALVGGGLAASVVYSLPDTASFHQDVVFTGFDSDFSPTNWGFAENSSNSLQIQIITEFYDPPQPLMLTNYIYREQDPQIRANMASPDLIDYTLDFGHYVFGHGRAYTTATNASSDTGVRVAKDFVTSNGRTFLIESVPYLKFASQLRALPPLGTNTASLTNPRQRGKRMRIAALDLPGLRSIQPDAMPQITRDKKIVRIATKPKGVTADYVVTVSSTVEPTLYAADTTYFVSGTVVCSGPTTIESAVFKYPTNDIGMIQVESTLTLGTTNYRPAVFTAADDNTIGTKLSTAIWSDYSGNPNGKYYGSSALEFETTADLVLNNLRFAYMNCGINYYVEETNQSLGIAHSQFVNCQQGCYFVATGIFQTLTINLNNCLMANASSLFTAYGFTLIGEICGCTVDSCGALMVCGGLTPAGGEFNITNSLFTTVYTLATADGFSWNGCYNGFYSSPTFGSSFTTISSNPYESVGAGNYYLPSNSSLLTLGTSSIPSALLSQLQMKTTQAPATITNNSYTANLTLTNVAQLDTAGTALGFHYDKIDYIAACTVSNATLSLTNGVVLAYAGKPGVSLLNGSSLFSEGTPIQRNYLVYYGLVQEQPVFMPGLSNAIANCLPILVTNDSTTAASAYLRFTTLCLPQGETNLINTTDSNQAISGLTLRDCEIYGAGANLVMNESTNVPLIGLTNNVFHRVPFAITNNATILAYNNLFYGTTNTNTFMISIQHRSGTSPNVIENNAFDGVKATLVGNVGYNAYLNGATNLAFTNNHDIATAMSWVAGPLGSYYQTNTSSLLNEGSTSAANLGLYHYTVETNMVNGLEVPEGDAQVSIGYHYVALQANGQPLDTAGDGIPDYVKDSNGDGLFDSGDLANWLSPFNVYNAWDSYMGWNPPYARLGYWRFNTTSWTNEAGVPPITATNVYPSNSFSGNAVSLTSLSSHLVYPLTSAGQNLFAPGNGSIRFWFQPNWSSTNSSAATNFYFFGTEDGAGLYYWNLTAVAVTKTNGQNAGTALYLSTRSNDYGRGWSFNNVAINLGALLEFQSNVWYQIVLTYSPTNVTLYTNGQFVTSALVPQESVLTGYNIFSNGLGNLYYPSISEVLNAFWFGGSESGSGYQATGQFDEFETFNYPMTAQQVAAGFPYFGGNSTNIVDTYYLGRSDMLQTYVDGFSTPSPTNIVPQCRLGYWRFDSPLLYAEQGQMPLSSSNVTTVPSWSWTALSIGSSTSSQVTYTDVGSNGWANVNCQQGSVRFWFKPNTTSGPGTDAPFVYMGTTNYSQEWALWLNPAGNAISFLTASNGGGTNENFMISHSLNDTNHWTQIVLTYGPSSSSLYINGAEVTPGAGVSYWPNLTNRQIGMVIGNTTAYNASINGQFEEMETFNYQLSASQILSNFQIVSDVDSDLDGVPDYLEDIKLSTNRPFLGAPVTITGTIEAEQFDMGGLGIAYSNSFTNTRPYCYRPTGMMISPCTDLGGGYCLDQMQANEWTLYTIEVLVAQNYMVDTRVSGIQGTDGVFQVEFTNGIGFSNSTGSLSVPTQTWTDVTNVVYLPAGIYAMKLHCLTNAYGCSNVARFNYISLYPWWPPPTNGPGAPVAWTNFLTNASDFESASSNAFWIQFAINRLPTNGGIITIPEGTWYVSQPYPNDASNANENAVACITNSNVKIVGATTNPADTVLIANNRATTIFELGQATNIATYQCSNFTLANLTLEANPHEVATNCNCGLGYTNIYEMGQLYQSGGAQGDLTVFDGWPGNQYSYNILISNCVFLNGIKSIAADQYVSNLMVLECTFVPWPSNLYFTSTTNNSPSNTLYTTNWQVGNVAVFGDGPLNAVIVSNIYIGNSALTGVQASYSSNDIAPDGFVWFQNSGNIFIAGNTISNNGLEGVQLNAGPNAVVGNNYQTLVSDFSCCALCVTGGAQGATGTGLSNYSTCFVGNSVFGGREGARCEPNASPFFLNFSGNSLYLYPPFNTNGDFPGGAIDIQGCQSATICGNTLSNGGYGLFLTGTNVNALLLNNNFEAVSYCGIGYKIVGDSLNTAQIFGNSLGQGVNFHVQFPYTNSFSWFLGSNTYWNINSNPVPLFTDPASSSIHIYQ